MCRSQNADAAAAAQMVLQCGMQKARKSGEGCDKEGESEREKKEEPETKIKKKSEKTKRLLFLRGSQHRQLA